MRIGASLHQKWLRILLALVLLAGAASLHAQGVDVIRGRATDPTGQPIEGARVTATSISGNVTRAATSDGKGRFTITFPNGDGDYMVAIAAVGYAQRRFEVKRTADQEILVADAQLSRLIVQLDSVKVRGRRERVSRDASAAPDISGTEHPVNASNVAEGDKGDLAAMAASIPGVTLVPGADGDPSGFSVLGLAPDQNSATLNGQAFDGSSLPRDAAVSSSLVTTPYDVSRGGFSGAQFAIRTLSGTNFVVRSTSLDLDAPRLQWTDQAARALGQQYSNVSVGGSLSGPIKIDEKFYSLAYQLGRRANDLQTLLNTDPLGLQTAGIAADSVARLLSILQQDHVPVSVGRVPSQRATDQGSLLASVDFAPLSSKSGSAYNLTADGAWSRSSPASARTSELPAHSGERVTLRGGVQARHSAYFGIGILSETSLGLNASRNSGSPFLVGPSGNVRVSSVFANGQDGLEVVSFGGSPFLGTSQSATSLSVTNQLSWFSDNNRHRLKFTTELRRDGFSQDQTTNQLGSFTYNSLADLENGLASSFTRQLAPRTRSGSQLIGGMALGDSYRRTDNLQLQYGVRLDGNVFNATIPGNDAIRQAFGTRNDNIPNRLYASPRLGFSWAYGTAPQIAGFAGAVRGPRAVVRGGIGVFQNTPATTLLSGAMGNTGLTSALQQVVCVGDAVPAQQWGAYLSDPGTIPARCADGTQGAAFANAAPNVALFAPDFVATRSVRSNLQWSGPILDGRYSATVDGTYSRNQHQPSGVDLNFDPSVQFTLADEGGRPVFARPSDIDAVTGYVAPGAARKTQSYSRVTETRSDLSSESRQLSVHLNPMSFQSNYRWSLAYVLASVREQVRGFSSTVGNPLDVAWGPSSMQPRHQVQYSLAYNFFDAVRANWFGSVRSGTSYTPLVAGDINGDGYANDRAFIFDPAHAADTALASSMRALLAGAPSSVRGCLQKQLGALARRNSCDGSWTSSATLMLSLNPLKFRMPQRATLSLQVSNPLAAADLLLHGESHPHGWGQLAIPDQALLYVRGFDPQTERYKYAVNQRFGSVNPAISAIRAPVALTLMMRFDLGPTRERQTVIQQLDRGRSTKGDRAPEPLLKLIYTNVGLSNPMVAILRDADTLHLSSAQADSIATLNRRYVITLDSLWTPVARALATLPATYDRDAAYARYQRAREASVDALLRLVPDIRRVLTPEQHRMLPATIARYLDPRYLESVRSGTLGGGASAGVYVPF